RLDKDHDRSFAAANREICEKGCTLRLSTPPPGSAEKAAAERGPPNRPGGPPAPTNQLELWAPNPMGIDKVEPGQQLTIATFKLPSFDLKASVFEGRAPLIFEQGQCERIAELPKQAKVDEPADEKAEAVPEAIDAGTDAK
ncbi:MAG: hypothetical protein AAFO75_12775, partial [Pseudomonadota bacterium]